MSWWDSFKSGVSDFFTGGDPTLVGSPSDSAFVDPSGAFGQAFGNMGNFQNFLQSQMGGPQMGSDYDPNAYMNQFMNQAGGLANLAQGATGPLEQQLAALGERQAARGADAAAQQFSGLGGARSGAAMGAVGEAMANPFAQAQAQLGQQQIGLTGDLWGRAMGHDASGQQFGSQMGFNYDQLNSQQQNMLNQMMGQNLGQMGQMGQHASGMWNPTYQQNPSGFQHLMQGVGTAASVKAAFGCISGKSRITLASGRKIRAARIKPGMQVLAENGNAVRVITVQKNREPQDNGKGFVRITPVRGQAFVISARHPVMSRMAADFIGKQTAMIRSAEWVQAPKITYDLLTESVDGGYQIEGIPVGTLIAFRR